MISLLVACLGASTLAVAAPADDLKVLLDQGKSAEAYQLGRSTPEQLGNPAFDFFYGIAGIEGGNVGDGVLALERYLLSFPDNRSARFQLARGYFVLGEDQRARDEFEILLPTAAGAEQAAISRFLDAIRGRESRYNPTGSAYVEFGLGYDSNLNAGLVSGATPAIPGAGNLVPQSGNAINVKENDTSTLLAVGAQGIYPVAPGVALYGALGADGRFHHKSNNDLFDQVNVGAAGGITHLSGRNIYKIGLGLGQVMVDNQRYLNTTGLNGEWVHQYDPLNRLTLGAQYARLEYEDMKVYVVKDKSSPMQASGSSIRSSDYTGISAGWSHVIVSDLQPLVTVSVNYGEERNRKSQPDLSRDILGLRIGMGLTPAPKWGASVGLGYQDIKHKARFAGIASEARKDRVLSFDASVSYAYDKHITLRGEYTRTDQSSNVGLFDYDRDMLAFKLRYEFK